MSFEDFLPLSAYKMSDVNPFTNLNQLDASKLKITHTTHPKPVPAAYTPEHATNSIFTDHMVLARWTATEGWEPPTITAYAPLSLPPCASVLHYSTTCFEGMKAYRGHDGKLRLFRPEYNCNRMLASAIRATLPMFPPGQLLELIRALCALDAPKWLPAHWKESTLYIRPTLIGIGNSLGVQPAQEALLFIVMTYFPALNTPGRGLHLVTNDDNVVRAWPGGTGSAKLGANYGPTMLAQAHAKKQGFDQVLWLLGPEGEVTEAGTANFFLLWRTAEGTLQLVTPALQGHTILPGLTRQTVLDLSRARLAGDGDSEWPGGKVLERFEVVEGRLTIHEIVAAADEDRLVAAFATGTAASVVPVDRIQVGERDVVIDSGTSLHLAKLREWIAAIVYGGVESPWTEVVEGA